ncbi:MAG TPA: lytic murein transglycosylase B [Burkholderiales bacterium]|nr:lytic murein transglycosylase B [Burkholderiales bacterium]
MDVAKGQGNPHMWPALVFAALMLGIGTLVPSAALAQKPLPPEIEAFVDEMAQKHQFDAETLRRLFSKVPPRPAILRAISAPGTARPWHEFRRLNVDAAHINGGTAFWRQHAAVLARASREYGVPEEIIVATIGIETLYGRNTGNHRVLDALTTLAFQYPPRAELFRAQLEEYLLLARESGFDMMRIRGSYAGAIGIPQFLPGSYRRYAVDFDGDGKRDLMGTVADAIGSVANYYKAHGWRAGEQVVVPAHSGGSDAEALVGMGIKPQLKFAELKRSGVVPAGPVADEEAAALFVVETETGPRYWLGLNNFYVITRYNRSVDYALAVYELARELRALAMPED